MNPQQTFRPTLTYWLKTWLPGFISWLIIMIFGVQKNIGTQTLNRAIGFSVFMSIALIALFYISTRRQIVFSPGGLFIQTKRKSFYWPWDQITSVDFYAVGEESKPRLFISTEQNNYKFAIDAFDKAKLEDAITAQIGSQMVGIGAYHETDKYKNAKERYELDLRRYGNSQKYIGGPVNSLMYIYALVLEFGLVGIALLFANVGNWFVVILFLFLSVFAFIRTLTLAGDVMMNRNNIVCRRPWGTHAMRWQDVQRVEVSYRFIIFRGGNQCLVCPGLLFWRNQYAKKLSYLFDYQIRERPFITEPLDIFSFPRNKNVHAKHRAG